MVGYFFWVIFTNKISKNSHYYRTGGKLLIHTFSLNSAAWGEQFCISSCVKEGGNITLLGWVLYSTKWAKSTQAQHKTQPHNTQQST
jgi:hypothetical protein